MNVAMNYPNPTRIDLFKANNLKSTSEQLFGIEEPPPYQCSNIDKVIKGLRSAEKTASRNYSHSEEDELRSALSDIEHDLWNLESEVEDIRKECERIREWGQAWKEQCKAIVNRSDVDLNEFI